MNNNTIIFTDGSSSGYAELPVPAAYLQWTRGNSQAQGAVKDDPALYFGGWRAFVQGHDNTPLPTLPLPIVRRVSADGKHPYQVYATNVLTFLPIQHRTRFELRERVVDPQTGREYERTVAVSKKHGDGYAPHRQVFGLVFGQGESAPAVLDVKRWSSFITFERAGGQWNKISVPSGKALLRRYGTLGHVRDGVALPSFEEYKKSLSTPIEAIGLDKPIFVDITPEMIDLWERSKAWAECPRWNAEGDVEDEPPLVTVAQKEYEAQCATMGLTNIEAAALLKENGGDYDRALAALTGNALTDEETINQALASTDIAPAEDPF